MQAVLFQSMGILCYLSIIASLAMASCMLFLGCPFDPVLVFTFGAIVMGVYVINRYTDREDIVNAPQRRLFFIDHPQFLALAISALALSALILLMTLKFTVFHLLLMVVGIIYSVELIPIVKKSKLVLVRLKDIPFVKNIALAMLWGSVFFVIPAIIYPDKMPNSSTLWVLYVSWVLANVVNTVFCDIRDYVGDKAAGVRTVPVVIGRVKTYLFVLFVPSLIWGGVLCSLVIREEIGVNLFAFLVVLLCYPLLYIGVYHAKGFFKQHLDIFIESDLLLFGGGMFLLHCIG